VPTTARARVRAQLVEEIKAAARRQLAEVGAADLSLRAVAREVGLVSSAVYRYFASRDELLTALVVDAYDAVGAAAEEAAASGRGSFEARWLRVAQAVRAWAREHPHEYALVYGSPVPGYLAPGATIGPATRPGAAALGVVAAGVESGEVVAATEPVPRALRADAARMGAELGLELPDDVLIRALAAWTQVFGLISFELFGHLTNVVTDLDEHFAVQVRRSAKVLTGW
jgi:AcrR family transcriptional regulator